MPSAERERAERREQDRRRKDTFDSVAEAFIARHLAGLRTARDAENAIRRDLVPPWRDRAITSITKHDVVEVIEDIIARRGTPGEVCYAAHHTLSYAIAAVQAAARTDPIEADELRDKLGSVAVSDIAIVPSVVPSAAHDGGAGLNTEVAKPNTTFDVQIDQAAAKIDANHREKNYGIGSLGQKTARSVGVQFSPWKKTTAFRNRLRLALRYPTRNMI